MMNSIKKVVERVQGVVNKKSLLPDPYKFLLETPQPLTVYHALAEYGVKEIKGPTHSTVILDWADEIGGWVGTWYDKDEIPWCGLFMGVVAKRVDRGDLPTNPLSALAWTDYGRTVTDPVIGDIAVFKRSGGGHVGVVVGHDRTAYHILGGNQSDEVNITRVSKERLVSFQRPNWNSDDIQGERIPLTDLLTADLSQNEQ